MSSIRHELAPSTNTSPTRDSYTISSSSSPTRWELRPWRCGPARNTPNSPRSGMVPPLVTASRWRAGPAVQGVGGPVPDQPGPQLGELLAGVAAGQHVQHGLQHRPGQPAERRRPADHLLQRADLPVVHRDHGDDLLGEDVERVARDAQLLDRPVPHPLGDHRRLHQVALVLGEEHAAGDVADVVSGPAGALQAAGHRRRRLDLDDQVHRAHVDAQLQAGGGDHGRQAARLQRLLDLRPLLPGHRAVVGPGDLGRRARRGAGLGHDLRRYGGGRRRGRRHALLGRGRLLGALGGEFVQPAAQPFGKAAGVGEDDGGPVLPDEVEYPLLHVRPDRALGGGRAGTSGMVPSGPTGPTRTLGTPSGPPPGVIAGGRVEVGHVLDRHHDLDLDLLAAGRGGDRDRPGPAEERRHLLRRPDGRRQPDPLGGPAVVLSGGPLRPGPARSASRRSSDSARCAPRLLPASACTSSTMTVSTPRSGVARPGRSG